MNAKNQNFMNHQGTPLNCHLSEHDKQFIARMYPGKGVSRLGAPVALEAARSRSRGLVAA